LFATALAVDRPAFAVLHVHGVGGVGNSALLRMFADQARQASRSSC
jgi:ABC-type transport system involved in cytochrome c biogenesis ATPase subunit